MLSFFGNMSISRANNFYTNAQKKHFSSNIWGQDPATPSITEEPRQVFHYIGERHKLSVFLMESSDNILYFKLYFNYVVYYQFFRSSTLQMVQFLSFGRHSRNIDPVHLKNNPIYTIENLPNINALLAI